MRVTVRLFAKLREIAGDGELPREIDEGATVRELWTSLVADYPALGDYTQSVAPGVNAEYARMSARLSEGDEVAFLPPVSGGAPKRHHV